MRLYFVKLSLRFAVKERANILLKKELSLLVRATLWLLHLTFQNWRELPFIGIELKSIEGIYAEPYEFPDFVKEMNEGALWNLGHPVYVFLGAQRTNLT